MSAWGCPYDLNGKCQRVPGRDCDMGMKGCVLFGRFTFADESKNQWRHRKAERARRGDGADKDPGPDKPGGQQPPGDAPVPAGRGR
jgi:hypothetical protein